MLPPTAESVTPAVAPVAWMLAVEAVGFEVNEVSVMEPRVVVTLIAVEAVVEPVINALAPKVILNVVESVKAPSSELTVELIAILLVVPFAEIATVPILVVVTGPLIVMVADAAEVVKAIAFAVSVIPDGPTIRLPVAAV